MHSLQQVLLSGPFIIIFALMLPRLLFFGVVALVVVGNAWESISS